MKDSFTIDRIALHMVNKVWDKPWISKSEVKLSKFKKKDFLALIDFFCGHLDDMWKSLESEDTRTKAVKFKKNSQMKGYYALIQDNPKKFFQFSKDMAQLLHDLSKPLNTSPGLLMVLWFKKAETGKNYLALFKMDPGKTDIINLREDETGEVLLDLAVSQIKQALPAPGGRVLKWALIPHPTLDMFDAKVKDKEGKPDDTAKYFIDFLGCKDKPNEKRQFKDIIKPLKKEINKKIGGTKGAETLRKVVNKMNEIAAKGTNITPQTVIKIIRENKKLEDVHEEMEKKLETEKFKNVKISGTALKDIKMQYLLNNGITINGRRDDMEAFVKIETVDKNTIEFRIRAADYEISYV